MMHEALFTLLLVSAGGSFLGLAMVLLRRLFQKRTPPALWYYLWIIIILRFLLPVKAPVAVSLPLPAAPAVISPAPPEGGDSTHNIFAQVPPVPGLPVNFPDPIVKETRSAPSVAGILLSAWALVAAGRLIYSIWKSARFTKLARTMGADAASIPSLWKQVEEAAKQTGLPRPPVVRVHNRIPVPVQLGLRTPTALLPSCAVKLGEQAVRHILIHEFVHCKRRDALYKWFIQLLVCIHWFNPLAYWFQRRISVDCELSCDAEVLRILRIEEHKLYGEMLLSIAGSLPNRQLMPAGSVMLSEGAKTLKSRLRQIAGYKKSARPLAALSGCLAALLLTCGFVVRPRLARTPLAIDESASAADTVIDMPEGNSRTPAVPQAQTKPRPVISVAGKIDFSVIQEHFFGEWAMIENPGFQVRIGYGSENFCDGHTRVLAAYLDESNNAVMEVMRGGAIDRHVVFAGTPDTIYTMTGAQASSGYLPDYTRTGLASEPPAEVFGYFDMLDYCLGDNPKLDLLSEADTPFHTFYYTTITLPDGSSWERSANLETPYPVLYLVDRSEDSLTLRSLFYPQGVEPGEEGSTAMREIVFTVAKDSDGWQIRSAALS